MGKKLIIDLAKAQLQEDSGVRCSYKHHPGNLGIDSLLEMIRFALICRRCELAPCVKACPNKALLHVEGEFEVSYTEKDEPGEPGTSFPKEYF